MQKHKCEICGNFYGQISNHVKGVHKISAKEYYDTYYSSHNCPICGKETRFVNIATGYIQYHKGCAQKADEIRQKISNTCKSEETIAKVKATCQQKYGTDFALQSETIRQKGKQTMLEHLGVESAMQSEEVKQKHRQSMKQHLGVEYALQSKEIYNNIRQTNLQKYGVEIFTTSKEYGQSKFQSAIKNNTLNKMEKFLIKVLEKHNISYIAEYKDYEKYPYFCDFYLPDTDTYIELHNYWMHRDHFFDKNNENDLRILAELKEKAKEKDIYNKAIEVWTISDIEKLECANKNHLNYVVLRTKEDINNWIDNYIEEINI